VRIVITLPEDETVRSMAFRNATMDIKSMIGRSELLVTKLNGILNTLDTNRDGVEVRYLPYPIGITAVIADPEHRVKKKRKAIVRYADFLAPYEEKLDFQLDGNESEKAFHYYHQQFLNMSHYSYKCMLLTGAPKAGKSTFFSQLVEKHSKEEQVFSVISKEITENGKRVGFEVKTSTMSDPKQFARLKQQVVMPGEDKYEFYEQIWTEIAQELLANQDKILVLDEIGLMQLRCEAFRNAIQQLINMKTTTVFATIALQSDPDGIIASLKNHYRTGVYELTPSSQEKTLQVFRDELMSSIKMYKKLQVKRDQSS
jgi:nucleoside-triphosphatase THEP1